jgi:hypothetical protein
MAESKAGEKQVRMGLGDAVRRLLDVEMRVRHVEQSPALLGERDMLLTALNAIELELGFDCDEDGTPDTVEIFQKSASTSCCRILPTDGSRRPSAPKRRRAASSRRKK